MVANVPPCWGDADVGAGTIGEISLQPFSILFKVETALKNALIKTNSSQLTKSVVQYNCTILINYGVSKK